MKAIPKTLIRKNQHHVDRAQLAAILITAGILAVALTAGSQLKGDVSSSSSVVFKKCRQITGEGDGVAKLGRFESCGIDLEATKKQQKLIEQTEQSRRKLTPQEDRLVIERMEEMFGLDDTRRDELVGFFEGIQSRLTGLLSSTNFDFNAEETATIANAKEVSGALLVQYDREGLTKQDVIAARDEIAPLLTEVQLIVTQKKRIAAASAPKIDNIIVKIDDLVAKMGTLIRDLDRAKEPVPELVRTTHSENLQLMREAKQECSLTRPEACDKLGQVLHNVVMLKDPICSIDSSLIQFCRS